MKISNLAVVFAAGLLLGGCGAPMFLPKPLDTSARGITEEFWAKPRVATTRPDTLQQLWNRLEKGHLMILETKLLLLQALASA